jgi:4-amino-4-deoxy-L-arabinose transferase-like glycosyltransferase
MGMDCAAPGVQASQKVVRIQRWELLLLGAILLVGAALRAGHLAELYRSPGFATPVIDPMLHDYWARALVTGDWTPPRGESDPLIRATPFFRPPGYPYFVALIYRVGGLSYLTPRLAQMALGLVNAVLAFLLARRWFGSATGLVLAGWLSTYWIFIFFEGEFEEPVLLIFLLLAHLLVLARWCERPAVVRALAAGVLLGLAALVKPNALAFLPLAVAWMWWIVRRRDWPRRTYLAALAFVPGCALALAPATIRNYCVAHDLVLISSNGGVNLYIGNNPYADGLFLRGTPEFGNFDTCFDYPVLVRQVEAKVGHRLTYAQVSDWFCVKALRFMADEPGRFLELTLRRALRFWGPDEISHNEVIDCERAASPILRNIPGNFPLVMALFLLGLLGCWRDAQARPETTPASPRAARRNEIVVLLILFILSYFLSYLFFFNAAQYRAPLIPFLMLFGADAVVHVARLVRSRAWRPAGGWVLGGAALFAAASVPIVPYESPGPVAWRCHRAKMYAYHQDFEGAVRELEAALAIDPEAVGANALLATYLRDQGRTSEAIRVARVAWRAAPRSADLHCLLGDLLLADHQGEQAREEYRQALRIDPHHAGAKRGLAGSATGRWRGR